MNSVVSRRRLLASAALGASLAAFSAQPAWAGCAVGSANVTCGTTVTTNTQSDGVTTPSTDREFRVDTTGGNFTGVINVGAVSGFGLAFTNTAGGNGLTVNNVGTIQVDAGNTPTAGGNDAALNISAVGATDVGFSGNGDILNLGTGEGVAVQNSGLGSVNLGIGGDVRADAGDAIQVVSSDASGDFVHVGTTIGVVQTIASSGGNGINILDNGSFGASVATGTGIAIVSGGAGVDTLQNGILVEQTGSGRINIDNNGAIGSIADRAQISGITATISNAGSAGNITVSSTGNIVSARDGIVVENAGTGTLTVNSSGSIASDAGDGIFTFAAGGATVINVTGGSVTTELVGIDARSTAGDIAVDLSGGATIAAAEIGIVAVNNGATGSVSVTTASGTAIQAGDIGIVANIVDATNNGTINVNNGADIGSLTGAPGTIAFGIIAQSVGLGAVSVTNNGAIGSATDAVVSAGIVADILNATSAAAISVTGSGDIFTGASSGGIVSTNFGTGTTMVNYSGAINSAGIGVFAEASGGGAVDVTLGAVTAGGRAVDVAQVSTTGTGAVSVRTNDAITGQSGIVAVNDGLGGINVRTTAGVTATNGNAILADQTNTAATGDVGVTVGTGGATSTNGDAVIARNRGSGNVLVSTLGDVTANSPDDTAILALNFGTGDVAVVTTTPTTTIRAGETGIHASILNTASTGDVVVANTGAIGSVGGAPNTINTGIEARTTGRGSVSVFNTGAIGSSSDGVEFEAILAAITNAASSAAVNVTGSGAISVSGTNGRGIIASNSGTGSTTVEYTGTVNSADDGVLAFSSGGPVRLVLGSVTGTAGTAVAVGQNRATGTGSIEVVTNGTISGRNGIDAFNAGLGGIRIATAGPVTATNGRAIVADQTNAASTGNVLVDVGAGGASATGGDAVVARTLGSGSVTVISRGNVTSNLDGIDTIATSGATAINIVGGSVTGGINGIFADATTGTISVDLSGGADVTGVDRGISVDSAGAKAITIGAGSTLTGPRAVNATGGSTITINNFGTFGAVDQVALFTDLATTTTIMNQDGGVMNGRVDLSDGSDEVVNAGTWNASGVQAFFGGTDVISNLATGTINFAAGTVFTGLEVLSNSGTLIAASGMTFDDGDTTFVNSAAFTAQGTLNFGLGTDLITNTPSGTFNVAAGTSILGLESFANAGTLNIASGVTFDAINTALTNTGTVNAGGIIDFGGGLDVLGNLAGATLNVAAGTSILGLESFANAGTLNIASGVTFDAINTALTNTRTVNAGGIIDFGGGLDVLNNLAGATLNVAGGTTFRGLERLNNHGTMNAASGITFDDVSTLFTNTSSNTLNVAGTVNFLGGDDSLVNSGAINVTGAATLDFGAGADSFTNSGTLNLQANLTLANLETFTSSGQINLNTFTLTGTGLTFTNGGTIDTNGNAGLLAFASIANAGTLDLAAGTFTASGAFTNSGTILADEGTSTITGQTGFANSGSIVLAGGATGDRLTINSGFVGLAGSNVLLDVSNTAADVLAISGAASGSTVININLLDNLSINTGGILLVDTDTSAADNTFTLGAGITGTGLIDIGLRRVGQDFFLVVAPNVNAFDPLALINIGTDMWFQSADVYSQYAAVKRSDLRSGGKPFGVWGQVYWNRDTYGDRNDEQSVFGSDQTIDQRLRSRRRGIQLGADYNFGMGVIGATAGWQRAEVEIREGITDTDGEGYNIGAYALVGSSTGLHGSLLVKRDHNKLEIGTATFKDVGKLTSKSFGIEGEIGYRIPVGVSTLDLGGGVAWVNTRHEDFTLAGIDYDYDRSISLRGNLGARFESPIGVFIDTRLFHEFRDDNDLTLVNGTQSDTLEADGRGTWFRGELGYGKSNKPGPIASIWGNVGDVHGVGAKLGFRF